MGTTYKGNARYYRSISENIAQTASVYPYRNGRFGVKGCSTKKKTRHIVSADPFATATDFYNRIAYGGLERNSSNKGIKMTDMADGTHITWRRTSTSDGSPVIDICISDSSDAGGIKEQKIHFVEG